MESQSEILKDDNDRPSIGAKLRQARECAGLSQGQTAKIMEMHRPTITEIEAGRRRVSVDELIKFASVYSVSTSWLIGDEESEAANPLIQLAARELAKLKPDDCERLIELLTLLKRSGGS